MNSSIAILCSGTNFCPYAIEAACSLVIICCILKTGIVNYEIGLVIF